MMLSGVGAVLPKPQIQIPEPRCCQVPVLFTGTMRDNLDPFEKHTDAEIWAALRRAHLAPVVENSPQVLILHFSPVVKLSPCVVKIYVALVVDTSGAAQV